LPVWLKTFLKDVEANVALTFGLLLPMLLVGAGVSVDYLRAYGAYSEMQTELDLALIAAIKKIDNVSTDEIEDLIEDWFSTQTRIDDFSLEDVSVDTVGSVIRATARAQVSTTLMQIGGINSVPIGVVSEVAGPATSYLNVYLVLDKSASMLLAATNSGQSLLTSSLGCAFSCHGGEVHTVNGVKYNTNYAYSSSKSVDLRSDVLLDAVEEVLATVEDLDPSGTRIRVGLYRLSTTTTQTLAPTYSMASVRTALLKASNNLTSASSTDGTYFDVGLTALAPMVGSNGDGTTAAKPLKLVMMITDGVQSSRSMVLTSAETRRRVTPLNPAWCDKVTQNGATFATVYTTYLPIPTDWGYAATLGSTMASSVWTTYWGGTLNPSVSSSITRRDYLPIALSDCATSADYFMQATDASEIISSLNTLFSRYLSTVRLTK
jgi:Flp pilus assembly protein TadG